MTISAPPQTSPYDGLVSRHLNRRISRPMARLLSHTPVTPNQITVFSLGTAVASLITFAVLAGSFAATYTQARVDESRRTMFDNGITSLASRGVRLLLIMVGALAGYSVETLVTLAVLTNAVVLLRIVSAQRALE